MPVEVMRKYGDVRALVRKWQSDGETVALVPTMGGLHDGHMALVHRACEIADRVVVSLFVNPTQFNNLDDLKSYPGNEDKDRSALEKTGTDVIYAPDADEMYPENFSTSINVSAASGVLCDLYRPGHFEGVATVVAKLFLQTGADFACFGEKDYQQLFIIRRMVRDLNIPVNIEPVPTVREKDGLAMSSRNARLNKKERKIAPLLNGVMAQARGAILNGMNARKACKEAVAELHKDGKFKVEYLELRSTGNLDLLETPDAGCRLFAAAWLGDVRLIDNLEVRR